LSALLKLSVYAFVLFLVVIVYVGQKHETAGATLRAALPKTLRYLGWTAFWLGVMFGVEALFID
jgi:hypothetical protein